MQRVRHLGLGAFKATSAALAFILVVTVALSAALLPWAKPALGAIVPESVELVSVNTSGTGGNNYGNDFSVSADGRFVAFDSLASDLVAGDSGTSFDVFLRDRQTGEITMESLNSDNVKADGWSYQPTITPDGRYVAFHSTGTNLIDSDDDGQYDDDGNGTLWDVFVRDRLLGETTVVSLNSDNAQSPYNGSWGASISADGRYVAFTSGSNSLVTPDTNNSDDIFVRDRQTHTTVMVSVASDNTQADEDCKWPGISADGRYVFFVSRASTLVAGDDNGDADIFARDLLTHTTTRVSLTDDDEQANGESTWFSVSPDCRYVAFASWANNLIGAGNDTNGNGDVFVRDLVQGKTTRVSVTSDNAQVSGNCVAPSISANGRYVAFQSVSDDLVDNDGDGVYDDDANGEKSDVFIHDRQTGETALISKSAAGQQGNDESLSSTTPPGGRCISAGGQYVVFRSRATNLVAGGTSGQQFFMAQLTVQPDVNQPDISVSPTSRDFGTVAIGSSSEQVFTVENKGTDNLTIGTVAGDNPLAAPFTKVTDGCSGQTILPGGSATLTVRFSPTAKGSFSDGFNIPSNDPDTATVTVSVTGATPNAAPTAPVVDVTPNSPATTADLVCTITTPSTDSDNDTITYAYQWHKNGAAQSGLTTNTVAAAGTAKGEVWKCVVTATDGAASVSAEDQVTIQNSAPTAPVATVTPESPDGATDLVCTVTTASTDADGDAVTYSYQWYKDGELQSALTTNTVAAANTADGQVWKCVVTATDGTASASPVEDQVTVAASGNGEPADDEPAGGFPWWAIIVIVIGLLLLLFFIFFLLFKRKKKKEEEEQPASQK